MQPGDEVPSGQDRQGWEAGSQEEKKGRGGRGQKEVGQREQAVLAPLPAQREPKDGNPEEASASGQGPAARGPGKEDGGSITAEDSGKICVFSIKSL